MFLKATFSSRESSFQFVQIRIFVETTFRRSLSAWSKKLCRDFITTRINAFIIFSSSPTPKQVFSRPLDYSINSYWINYWISFLVIFILLNKNFKKLFLFLMNKILGYLTIYSIILFFIIQLISLKIFRARSAREWIFIKRKKNFPKKPISELGTPPLKLNLPLL